MTPDLHIAVCKACRWVTFVNGDHVCVQCESIKDNLLKQEAQQQQRRDLE